MVSMKHVGLIIEQVAAQPREILSAESDEELFVEACL